MQDFFSTIYIFLHGIQQDPRWDDVYLGTGVSLFVLSVIFSVLYYYILNRKSIVWYSIPKWFLIMGILCLTMFLISLSIASNTVELPFYRGEVISFGLINVLYAAILFALLPFLISWWSPRARYTPYRFFAKN